MRIFDTMSDSPGRDGNTTQIIKSTVNVMPGNMASSHHSGIMNSYHITSRYSK